LRSFINTCIDSGFDVAHANRNQQFPHESDIWAELPRSNVHNVIIGPPTETEKQQHDILSKGCAHLSIRPGTIGHVLTLEFIPIREASMGVFNDDALVTD
jgi:hypothetical protein